MKILKNTLKNTAKNLLALLLWATLMSLANHTQAQTDVETFEYSYEKTTTDGGWFFIQRTTTTRPGGTVLVNELKTFRATEVEIDSFISGYKRGLEQELITTEAAFNDVKARQGASSGVGPAMMRTPSKTAIPDTTVRPENGSIWTWDGSGYVPYVCPPEKKKAPAKPKTKKQ